MITRYFAPAPDRFVRDITTFVPDGDGGWRRDDERHENVLLDTATLPAVLDELEVTATVAPRFEAAELPGGLVAVTGFKRS